MSAVDEARKSQSIRVVKRKHKDGAPLRSSGTPDYHDHSLNFVVINSSGGSIRLSERRGAFVYDDIREKYSVGCSEGGVAPWILRSVNAGLHTVPFFPLDVGGGCVVFATAGEPAKAPGFDPQQNLFGVLAGVSVPVSDPTLRAAAEAAVQRNEENRKIPVEVLAEQLAKDLGPLTD